MVPTIIIVLLLGYISFRTGVPLGRLVLLIIGIWAFIVLMPKSHAGEFVARDTMGRELGRAVTDSHGNTTFYNERGQTTGRAVTNNGTTTTYNPLGQQTGTIRSNRK